MTYVVLLIIVLAILIKLRIDLGGDWGMWL